MCRHTKRLRPLSRHLEQFSAPAKTIQVSQHRVSRKLGEQVFAGRVQHRESDLSETKLRDLKIHRNTALVTCLSVKSIKLRLLGSFNV